MMIKVVHNQNICFEKILLADNPLTRVIGLMFKSKPTGDGLLLDPCNSIHTFFMRYPLDVAFLDNSNKIVKIIRGIKPWRMTWIYFKAKKTLELPAGRMPMEWREGDILEVRNV